MKEKHTFKKITYQLYLYFLFEISFFRIIFKKN
jgi:hypothetical protein